MTIILIIIFLILLSGFFSGSETALTGVSSAKIYQLKTEGNKKAGMVEKLRSQKEKLIGAILLGNNAVNILASALATSFAISVAGDSGVFYATVIMTFLVLIFAEVLPKTYAFHNTEKVALVVSPIFLILVKILSPITSLVQFLVDISTRTILFLCGKKNSYNSSEQLSDTIALKGSIAMHHKEGAVVKYSKDMLKSILDLSEIEVDEVMVHRKDVESIDIEKTNKEIIDQVLKSSFTRFPVWQNDQDNIVGILHSKNLMKALESNKEREKINVIELLTKPWFVPEKTNLKKQLEEFRRKHSHFALVVDEYGGLQGIVTLEDILEEIVGDIEDEYDSENKKIKEGENGNYDISGDTTIRDLNRELDWELPDEKAATIAGLIINEAEIIPEVGQSFRFFGTRFEIIKRKRNQILLVRVKKEEEKDG